MKTNAQIRDIQYWCDEVSQWTSLYANIDRNNKVIKEIGYEKLEGMYRKLAELLKEEEC